MNTYYVKDMRKKVDASITNRLKHSKFVTRVTPFGYVCDDVKEGWKKDPEAAKTVRLIFKEAVAGKNTSEIARLLNEKGAETPGDVRSRHCEEKRDSVMRKTRIWTSSMVRDVLRNEQYERLLCVHQTDHPRVIRSPDPKHITYRELADG